MMEQLEYVPGSGGPSVKLNCASAVAGSALGMRSREWDRKLGYRDLVSATRPAREVTASLVLDYDTANALRRVADADVAARTPGTFVFQDEWRQRGYMFASQPTRTKGGWLSAELTIALLDGAWWRLVQRSFSATGSGGSSTAFLDYPYDYDYDFTAADPTNEVEASVLTPSNVHIVIYGAAVNPYIIVDGNRYQVNVSVPAGGYLTVDGREKTIILTLANGTTQDVFSAGVRGSGQGGGEYIFEPLPRGAHEVTWDGSFSFDFGWYEEEGEPPWSLS